MPRLKNTKHEIFAHNVVKTKGNQKQAYIATYPKSAEISAENNSTRLISNEGVRTRIQELLERTYGAKLDILLNKTLDLADADKKIILDKQLVDVPDNSTRLEAQKVLYKLHGLLIPKSGDVNIDKAIVFNLNPEHIQELSSVVQGMKEIASRGDRISGKVE